MSKKAYILYNYNEFNNDYNFINEYYNIKELIKKENIKLKNNKYIYQYITNNIEEIKHLLNNKYIIIKEEVQKNEL
jgi:hypothetical protein